MKKLVLIITAFTVLSCSTPKKIVHENNNISFEEINVMKEAWKDALEAFPPKDTLFVQNNKK